MNEKMIDLIKQQYFVEALYFGGLKLSPNSSASDHLYIGLSCCASIKSLANFRRELLGKLIIGSNQLSINGLVVKVNTLLVNEGLHHFIKAIQIEPRIEFPSGFEPVISAVLQDLHDYSQEELHAFPVRQLDYSLKSAAQAAVTLLAQIAKQSNQFDFGLEIVQKVSLELITKLSIDLIGKAAFYPPGDTRKLNADIKQYLLEERWLEALYFGVVQLGQKPSVSNQFHLELGLACCGVLKPVLERERLLSQKQNFHLNSQSIFVWGLDVSPYSQLVEEGVAHLREIDELEDQGFLSQYEPIIVKVKKILHDYFQLTSNKFSLIHREKVKEALELLNNIRD